MKKLEMYVPTNLITKLTEELRTNVETRRMNEKQHYALLEESVNLFLFIEQKCNNDFVNIHTDELKRFQRKPQIDLKRRTLGYRFFIKLLQNINAVVVNEKYSKSKFTKSYKIDERIYGDIEQFRVNFAKIQNINIKENWIRQYPHLLNQIINSYNAEVDITAYQRWLEFNEGMELSPVYNKKKGIIEKRKLTKGRIMRYLNDALKINMNILWFKQSNEGRLYSSITNLNKTALPFLKIDNETVKSIDVKNCQPLLLTHYIQHPVMSMAVEEGTFYDLIANEMKISRDETKILLYRYVFFNDKPLISGKLYNAMEKLFKGVTADINKLKKDNKLYSLLQTLESDIFVKNNEKETRVFITRHDEILTSENNIKYFVNILTEKFKEMDMEVKFNY